MSGASRTCYHGVPLILAPSGQSGGGGGDGGAEAAEAAVVAEFLRRRRINVNVRQVTADDARPVAGALATAAAPATIE